MLLSKETQTLALRCPPYLGGMWPKPAGDETSDSHLEVPFVPRYIQSKNKVLRHTAFYIEYFNVKLNLVSSRAKEIFKGSFPVTGPFSTVHVALFFKSSPLKQSEIVNDRYPSLEPANKED